MSFFALLLLAGTALAEEGSLVVRPQVIDDVLLNPGIGFTSFQRFNDDVLTLGLSWPEAYLEGKTFAKRPKSDRTHPQASIAYLRFYWKQIEVEKGTYRWNAIDEAFRVAAALGQSLMLRLMPYGELAEEDVPTWYRESSGDSLEAKQKVKQWRIDHERPFYADSWGRLIRAFAERYDGHTGLESVDIAIVGPWGEGVGAEFVPPALRLKLLGNYYEGFRKTKLLIQPWDLPEAQKQKSGERPALGFRVDCLGDVGGFSPTWSHMFDLYPQIIVESGLRDAWKSRPVAMEACWVMQEWAKRKWDLDYIIEQSLKWHISSFNAKSSAVPSKWRRKVDRLLKRMGYRLALRKFSCPKEVKAGGVLQIESWWENLGVAPPYFDFTVALRLRGGGKDWVIHTPAKIREWLPGDHLNNAELSLPEDLAPGDYEVTTAIVDPRDNTPRIRLAIAGRTSEGWYPLGKIRVLSKNTKAR